MLTLSENDCMGGRLSKTASYDVLSIDADSLVIRSDSGHETKYNRVR